MSSKSKFVAAALAALTVGASAVVTTSEVQAGHWHHGWGAAGAGFAAGALIGAAVASSAYGGPAYVVAPGYRRCRFVPRYDAYGFYIGSARVCAYH